MGTPFEELYKMFLSKIQSYNFYDLDDYELEEELVSWLDEAVNSFSFYCKQDIDSADTTVPNGYFNVDLSRQEKQIISDYMVLHYVEMNLNDLEATEQTLNSRDYRMYSEANYLEAKSKLRDRISKKINQQLSRYSYHSGSLSKWLK